MTAYDDIFEDDDWIWVGRPAPMKLSFYRKLNPIKHNTGHVKKAQEPWASLLDPGWVSECIVFSFEQRLSQVSHVIIFAAKS